MAKTRPTPQGEGKHPDEQSVERRDSGAAFMDDPGSGEALIDDDLAETLAEEFVRAATSGEDTTEEALDQFVSEEIGGPFVETSASEEFATGSDSSNPDDATTEPLPRAVSGLVLKPRDDKP